ncbi:hypothetical protein [Thermaurantiacus sp.]
MNGLSDLPVVALGGAGKAGRSAAGVASLPGGIAEEVEATVALRR